MKTLIIGYGEIGKSLDEALNYETTAIDSGGVLSGTFVVTKEAEIMHICFPYSDKFIEQVKGYQEKYQPKYTVIHSTVPVGTSRQLGAIHSPVIGIHPHLTQSLKTFTKFLGGEQASEVADYFRRSGIKVCITDKPETTELMKILDTTHYGIEIEYVKDIKKQCDKFGVPFEMWSVWVNNYNWGYEVLGYPEYKKPNLTPIMTRQGGHCVLQNCEILETEFTKLIKRLNDQEYGEK